jgi:hypothetical protein
MGAATDLRRKHDIAYACFLAPGVVSLIASMAPYVPMDTGTAGGIGFLVLIPLSMVALATVPIGVFYSIMFWRDAALPILSILTILMLAQVIAEAGPVTPRNVMGLVYGVIVLILEASWFLVRRRRAHTT